MRSFQPPSQNEYHEFYAKYVSLVAPESFNDLFESQPTHLRKLVESVDASELSKYHEPYTWTIKQVIGHLIDGERIFSDRMIRVAVGDESPIPGIDQKMFIDAVDYQSANPETLLEEFELLRRANVLAAKKYSEKAFANIGTAADNPVSARANLYILVGHVTHHTNIIRKRLL